MAKKPIKKPAPKKKGTKKYSSVCTMTIVCDDHKDCLKFAKKVKDAAGKVKGAEKIRELAEGFVPG